MPLLVLAPYCLVLRRLLASEHPTPPTVLGLTPSLLRAFVALFLFYGVADMASTALAFHTGRGWEGNPLAAYVLAHTGLSGLYLLKLFALAACYAIACLLVIDGSPHFLAFVTFIFYALAALFALVSFSNLFGYFTGTDFFHFLLFRLVFFLFSL